MSFSRNENTAPRFPQAFAAGGDLTKPALVCVKIKAIEDLQNGSLQEDFSRITEGNTSGGVEHDPSCLTPPLQTGRESPNTSACPKPSVI